MQYKMTVYYYTDKHVNEDHLMDAVEKAFTDDEHATFDGAYVQLVSVHKRQIANELANDIRKEGKKDGTT